MIPHSGFVEISGNPSTFILIGGSNSNTTQTTFRGSTFEIPHYANMINIMAVGAGGGGGSGQFGLSGTIGGGGGASGAVMSLTMPTLFLPSKIYAIPGLGGAGGDASNSGTGIAGSATIVSTTLERGTGGAGCIAFAYGGNGGLPGPIGTGGLASVNMASLVASGISPAGTNFGVYNLRETRAGGNGGSATSGTDATFAFVSGGGGGGAQGSGTGYNGGGVAVGLGGNGTGTQPDSSIYTTNPDTGGDIDGAHGIIRRSPLYFTGGVGGKGYVANNGGRGGNGAPGCGGGGSGAGGSSATAFQTGGRGGDGFVIISVW